MNLELPPILTSLLSFLKKEDQLVLISQEISQSFDDSVTIFSANSFHLRLVHDRSIWSIEISSKDKPAEWYEMDLIIEYITKKKELLPLDEQVAYFRENLKKILNIFDGQNGLELRNYMRALRDERAKRRFSKWLK